MFECVISFRRIRSVRYRQPPIPGGCGIISGADRRVLNGTTDSKSLIWRLRVPAVLSARLLRWLWGRLFARFPAAWSPWRPEPQLAHRPRPPSANPMRQFRNDYDCVTIMYSKARGAMPRRPQRRGPNVSWSGPWRLVRHRHFAGPKESQQWGVRAAGKLVRKTPSSTANEDAEFFCFLWCKFSKNRPTVSQRRLRAKSKNFREYFYAFKYHCIEFRLSIIMLIPSSHSIDQQLEPLHLPKLIVACLPKRKNWKSSGVMLPICYFL